VISPPNHLHHARTLVRVSERRHDSCGFYAACALYTPHVRSCPTLFTKVQMLTVFSLAVSNALPFDALSHLAVSTGAGSSAAPGPPSAAAYASEGTSDEDAVQEARQIDQVREQALITAKEERERRAREQRSRWVCGNVLSAEVMKEDELETSTLLSHLKRKRHFEGAAGIKVTAEEAAAHNATHNSSPGKAQRVGGAGGGGGKGGGMEAVATKIVYFKSCVADLLELEKRLVKWYPKQCEALLEEVAQRLCAALDTASGMPSSGRGRCAGV